ncbi:hypothetical protein GIB67_003211 [Kingdonia uniflora]|uniref:E3 ubiquitin-protein ligase RMA n=1 Tax=Kingdonia uniflora TaxID=39325 RepID=A0A7J7LH31_9MAGN|nr:hypothetical protein GIB67_003211 [Kingdonia uniflora]
MDLDLNLRPSVTQSVDAPPMDEHLLQRIRRLEEISLSPRHRWRRWRQGRAPPQTQNPNPNPNGALRLGFGFGPNPSDLSDLIDVDSIIEIDSNQVGEASGSPESCKRCRRNSSRLIADALKEDLGDVKKESSKKGKASFFDCYICFEMAKDPVLTSCGHMFCWPCLYQWIHVYSTNNECPVCKGEVKDTNITPIYGRGSDGEVGVEEEKVGVTRPKVEIPSRPKAQRVESLRQSIHRAESSFSFEEILRRFISRNESNGEPGQGPRNLHRASRILSRLTRANAENVASGAEGSSRTTSARALLRTRSQRDGRGGGASVSPLSSALSSAERLVQAYFLGDFTRGENIESSTGEDRDSVSSIAAVIHTESQTTDTAIEIDSEMDSGVSRSSRRRRIN